MVGLLPKNPVPIPLPPAAVVAAGRIDWEPNSPPPEDEVITEGCLEPENMNDGGTATWMEGGTVGEG